MLKHAATLREVKTSPTQIILFRVDHTSTPLEIDCVRIHFTAETAEGAEKNIIIFNMFSACSAYSAVKKINCDTASEG
jgi:hypothetical protein